MKKLEKLSVEQLKELKLKNLYAYKGDWYDRYLINLSDAAYEEFVKAKSLIKTFEKWENSSKENWMKLRTGIHTYNDFIKLN